MHRAVLLALVSVAACKTRGTITLDFDLDGDVCTPFGSAYWSTGEGAGATCRGTGSSGAPIAIDRFVLYAEPDISCSSCACGQCFGTNPRGIQFCPDAAAADCSDVRGLDLDLSPGLWALVLEAYAPASDDQLACLVASQCIDVVVDSDGVASSVLSPEANGDRPAACQACAAP